MFRQVLQSTDTAHNKISVWRETSNEKLRMDTLERRDGQEQMMKLLEDQTEMFKSLITLLSEHIHAQVPLQLIRNSIPCPPQSPHHILSMFPVPHSTPCTQPRGTGFTKLELHSAVRAVTETVPHFHAPSLTKKLCFVLLLNFLL